jgi:TRAP-type mannitol/chloroaromatic compound transport system permease small subunit
MSSPTDAEPRSGGSGALRWVRAAVDWLAMSLNVIGTLLIFALMILVNADVIGRTAFLAPISGVPEIVSMSIVAIVFLQIAQAFRKGSFTRTDAVLGWVSRRAPRLRHALEFVYTLAALALVWFLFRASYPLFQKSWARSTYIGTVGDFTAPEWPVKLVILIGCAALMLQLVMAAAASAIAFVRDEPAAEAHSVGGGAS